MEALSILEEGEELFRSCFEAAACGFLLVDYTGRIILANSRAEGIFGYDRGELQGEPVEALIPQHARATHAKVRQAYAWNPKPRPMGVGQELLGLRKDGKEIPLEVGLTPLKFATEWLILCSIVDITERKRSDRLAEAEHTNEMITQFLTTVSHELRTPLNAILGWSNLIKKRHDSKTLQRGLDIIEQNAHAQAELISDLLDTSRIVSGKLRLNLECVDVRDLINCAADTALPTAEAKGIQIEKTFEGPLSTVWADRVRLQQCLWNLLTNSMRFTPEGGKISILANSTPKTVDIHVTDTGDGIAAESIPHVFERFWQGDQSAGARHGGLGLGLAIVKQLAELHGGTAQVKSAGRGLGSTFTVSLPYHHAKAPSDSTEKQDPKSET